MGFRKVMESGEGRGEREVDGDGGVKEERVRKWGRGSGWRREGKGKK